MSTASNTGGQPGMKLWLKLLLAASLALNLAVIGIAAGAAWRYSGKDRHWQRPPTVGAMIFRELDRDTRKALRAEAGGGHGSYFKRRHAEGAAVIDALRSADFDAAALLAVLRTQSDARHVFHTKVQEAWVRKLEAMTAQERAAFADRMEERMQRRGGRWHERRKGRD
ncbi:periplasmic heavy metal sensor [Leisingera sp. HS039]|uniref:periplasmic heavy metal sensor n=1 Tax=unclassified Leisingera TaxID=2614906 RepID=UPI001070D898|nr:MULTISPECIES: periplasmic heavy metal sensor [unclassified Leisingera]MBQ4827181.1 periplasmic heavy metal sensor [Leisingera sp. HS039]QBR35637.1 periplasmic heavy metal sensor [Leisingera sp. NJS201]